MPKLRESKDDIRDKEFRGLIKYKQEKYGIDHDELALRLHMDPSTLRRQIKDPNKFRIGATRTLFEVLRFTEEEKNKVM